MRKSTKTYVKFIGEYRNMRTREKIEEVSSRNIEDLEIPDWAIGFEFFDKTTVTYDNGRTFESEPFNVGPTFQVPEPPRGTLENPW